MSMVKKIETIEETNKADSSKKKYCLKKQTWLKILEYCTPALITIFIAMLALLLKGIYPFGKGATGSIDYNVGMIPSYSYLWDVLHGKASPFIDFQLGGGTNAFISVMANILLMPFDLIIGIFPRESLFGAAIFVVIVKLAVMSVTEYWFFKKTFTNVNKYICLIFSILWVFSGWVMVHYTNVGWLDILILLPLLVDGVIKVVKKNSLWQFVVILSWMIMIGYYLTYMELVALVVCSFVYVLMCTPKSDKKRIASRLFFGLIISVLISCVFFIPGCLTSLGSHRFTPESTTTDVTLFNMFFSKAVVLLLYSLPIVLIIKLICKYKEDKRNIQCFLVCLSILLAGLFIEPINQMWHTGSYWCFPYRYSFIIIFFISCMALYFINRFCEKDSWFVAFNRREGRNFDAIAIILCIPLLMLLLFMALVWGLHPYKQVGFLTFISYFTQCLLGGIIIWLALRSKKSVSIALIISVCVGQVLAYTYKFMGSVSDYTILQTTEVQKIDTEGLEKPYRIKDKDYLYFENYARVIDYPSIATWYHISSENQWQTHNSLGYYNHGTSLSDAGGTLFSDMLLGNRYFISETELNDTLFELVSSWDNIYQDNFDENQTLKMRTVWLYEFKYALPYIFAFDSDEILKDFDKQKNPIEIQNDIYKNMFGKSDNIIDTVNPSSVSAVDEEGFVTINFSCDTLENFYMIGNVKELEIGDYQTKPYSNLYDLGTYSSDFSIKVKSEDVSKIIFAKLAVSDVIALHDEVTDNLVEYKTSGRNLYVTYNNTENKKYAFIPLTYLDNFEVKVNGDAVDTNKAINGYLAVKLVQGENSIQITFHPQYAKICLIVTIVGVLLFVVFMLLNRRFKLCDNNVIQWIGTVGALIIFAVVAFLVYIKPLARFIVALFKMIF